MSILFFLIPLSIVAAAGFLTAFIWAVRSGQYEDTCTPSMRVLVDDRNAAATTDAAMAPVASNSPRSSRFHSDLLDPNTTAT